MDTVERMRVLHNFFRPDERDHDNLDVALVRKKGHRLTDYIAPDGMEFQADYFKIGRPKKAEAADESEEDFAAPLPPRAG